MKPILLICVFLCSFSLHASNQTLVSEVAANETSFLEECDAYLQPLLIQYGTPLLIGGAIIAAIALGHIIQEDLRQYQEMEARNARDLQNLENYFQSLIRRVEAIVEINRMRGQLQILIRRNLQMCETAAAA